MKQIQEIRRQVPPHWVGDGFPVRSLFSYHEGNSFDPFLLLDYAGPHQFSPHEAKRGVGEHPHRGFETVTIVYQGELEHRDSSGSQGSIGPGDVQWMTAASGVVHEEFHSEKFTREGGTLEMVQLWVNLPAQEKMSTPRYQEILSQQIPVHVLPEEAGTVRVIAGSFASTSGPAKTVSPILAWDVQLNSGKKANLEVPAGYTCLVVVQQGEVVFQEKSSAKAVELVQFDRDGSEIRVEATSDARFLLLAGEPLQEPVVGQGPFVMNTQQQIREAILDYQAGRMGHLPS